MLRHPTGSTRGIRIPVATGVLCAPLAVAAGHGVGYGLVGGHSGTGHGHMGTWVSVAAALALSGMAVARRSGSARISLERLLVVQVALFLALEVAEHVAAGAGAVAVLESPAVWLGLSAQLVTAVAAGAGITLVASLPGWLPALCPAEPCGPGHRGFIPVPRRPTTSPRPGLGTVAARRAPPSVAR